MTLSENTSANGGISFGPTKLELASGKVVDLTEPKAEDIDILDISTALGNTCRYGGHVRRFYSVAEHSILCYNLVNELHLYMPDIDEPITDPHLKMAVLLHDAPEAYLGDIISPLKYTLRNSYPLVKTWHPGEPHPTPDYDQLNFRFEIAIAQAIGLRDFQLMNDPIVRLVDLWALKIEADTLTRSKGVGWAFPPEIDHLPIEHEKHFIPGVQCMAPSGSARAFERAFTDASVMMAMKGASHG